MVGVVAICEVWEPLCNWDITNKGELFHGILEFKNYLKLLFYSILMYTFIICLSICSPKHSNSNIVRIEMLDNIGKVIDFKELLF